MCRRVSRRPFTTRFGRETHYQSKAPGRHLKAVGRIPAGMSLPLSGSRPARELTPTGFNLLLSRLHADRDQAAAEYERMRRVLVKFFDWRGVERSEECADITIDRLARRLEDEVEVHNVQHYALGIARLVALEALRTPLHSPLDRAGDVPAVPAAPQEDERARSFERCLAEFPDASRKLLLQYYDGGRGQRMSVRQELARALRISEGALRSRVQRLRDRLEQCIAARQASGNDGER
jgi:DNA-directed RNA polymerase specialized sigma24 family protein